jgi:hypothetical protein
MRAAILVMVAACGAATTSAPTTGLTESPTEPPPADLSEHQHTGPAHADDPNKLYVEVTSDGDHAPVIVQSATSALAGVNDMVAVTEGGDLELHAEVSGLVPITGGTSCKLKVYVLRLPQHDLLAIADGSARVTGGGAVDSCLTATGSAIVRDKLPVVLDRQLQAKK